MKYNIICMSREIEEYKDDLEVLKQYILVNNWLLLPNNRGNVYKDCFHVSDAEN